MSDTTFVDKSTVIEADWLNAVNDHLYHNETRVVALTTTPITVTRAAYDGKYTTVDKADGCVITLPAATGTGAKYTFIVGTTITSNNFIVQVANASDVMQGAAIVAQDGGATLVMFETAADSDTVTGNGTTTGGIKGDKVEVIDIATNLFQVNCVFSATGTEATPFSAAVS